MSLTHLSLFSGIGGIDLAAEWAGFETVGQCEWADYPTKVLEKHWPNVERWKDVRDFTADEFRRRTGIAEVTLLSGGFPCQPHSLAGKRESSSDERDLWPEYRRIIGEIRPTWILAENVRGLLTSESGRFFRGILRDLSELGFDVGWCTYPASWVGAIHRRERVFIVAHTNNKRWNSLEKDKQNKCFKIAQKVLDDSQKRPRLNAEQIDILQSGQRSLYIDGGCDIRNDDGFSEGVHRLECIGNAVSPDQVYPILKAIAELEVNND